MPSSYPHNISKLLATIIPIRPRSVYDVGVGYGKWGMLIREYVDDFMGGVWIEGCEIFRPYIERSSAKRVYDHIAEEDWLTLTPQRGEYDLVLMIDVLEHFSSTQAVVALDKALNYSRVALVSTPLNYPQGAVNGNQHERHLSEWRQQTFADAGFVFHDMGSDERSTIGLVMHEWAFAG
jgi:2-polyprenyl-3-methyl-5-hydroxy-6-metoxy-1,4-benzoquinol methylase